MGGGCNWLSVISNSGLWFRFCCQKVNLVISKVQEVVGRTNHLLSFDTTRTAYKMTCPTILLLLGVYSFP
jgi:hypothetical protein